MNIIEESLYRISGVSLNEEIYTATDSILLEEMQKRLIDAKKALDSSNFKAICVGFSNGRDRFPLYQEFKSMSSYYLWRDKMQAGWAPKLEFYTVYKDDYELIPNDLYDDFLLNFKNGKDWDGNIYTGKIKCDKIKEFTNWFNKNNVEYNYYDMSGGSKWSYLLHFNKDKLFNKNKVDNILV